MEEQKVNNSNNIDKKQHDFRNIILTFLGVFVILAAVSGGTFAYYAFNASNNNTITGTAAATGLTLEVSRVSPTTNGPLVPQPKAGLKTAFKSGCVDGNSNKVCQVYKITVTNIETSAITVGAGVTFTYTGAFQNLRWTTLTGDPTATDTSDGTAVTPVTDSNYTSLVALSPTAPEVLEIQNKIGTASLGAKNTSTDSKTWYIVVWIEETVSYAQNSLDYGSFTGIVRINDSTGRGLTSTFTG